MATKLCGAFVHRNASILTLPSSSNHSNISDVEWIITGTSLVIFVFAFVGNTAALIVMFGSRGPIRLTNNTYLANLACADLLRACFMPFTIIARWKRNFIFGKMICKILPVVQGLSVAVDVFTLICISIERYLAICRPLFILKLQSIRFSNLLNCFILLLIWSLGFLIAIPNLFMYNLCSLPKPGRFKCEKISPVDFDEKLYMIVLDAFYFVIPMVFMVVLYTLIIRKMYHNGTALQMRSCSNSIRVRSPSTSFPLVSFNRSSRYRSAKYSVTEDQRRGSFVFARFSRHLSYHHGGATLKREESNVKHQKQKASLDSSLPKEQLNQVDTTSGTNTESFSQNNHCEQHNRNNSIDKCIDQVNFQKSGSPHRFSLLQSGIRTDRHRRKAIKILITLIMEFFICWTPLFIYHTIGTFNKSFYRSASNIYLDLILLFSFASASCNPLTYYFMSNRYRTALYAYLQCCSFQKDQRMFIKQKRSSSNYMANHLGPEKNEVTAAHKNCKARKFRKHQHIRSRSKTF